MAARDSEHKSVRKTLLELLELPEEILLNLTKVTTIGASYVGIENHRGILKYQPQSVQIKINPGILEIAGEELVIRNVYPDEIIVEGKIQQINFQR